MANSVEIVCNQSNAKSFESFLTNPLKHNNRNPFTRDELRFLESYYISIDLDNCVGRGTFGSLYVALTHRHSYVVLKRYESQSEAFCESEVLALFGKHKRHRNLITFYGSYGYKSHLYLLIEYSNVGDLGKYYAQVFTKQMPSEMQIYDIFSQICAGVEHMHSYGWAHRDLKIENILGFRDPLNPFEITFKLTDFGSAVYGLTSDGKCATFETYCGSPFTMPPEVTQNPYNPFLYDSYSLGVILYELSHDLQFPHSTDQDYCSVTSVEWLISHNKKKNNLNSIHFRNRLTPELKALILGLIAPNPIHRTIVHLIRESKWWKGIRRE